MKKAHTQYPLTFLLLYCAVLFLTCIVHCILCRYNVDCIWENISIPLRQITMRRAIADGTLIVGAVFWSIVVVRILHQCIIVVIVVIVIVQVCVVC